jgi:serine/threonine-protein kinase
VEILNTTKDPRAFDKLLGALDDTDWWVRERALDALANMRDIRAVQPIFKFLQTDNEATPIAIRALAAIGDPSAAAVISDKLGASDEAIVREAIAALERLCEARDERVLAALAAVADSAHAADVKQAAARTHAAIAGRARQRSTPGPMAQISDPRSERRSDGANRTSAGAQPARSVSTPVPPAPPKAGVSNPRPAAPAAAGSSGAAVPQAPRPPAEAKAPAASAKQHIDFSRLSEGQLLGDRYRVKRELGRGGFGIVLLVDDLMVHEEIALKLINPHLIEDDVAVTRMVHEVRYARKITHENVIRIHDFLAIGATYAMSMEYFASVPLTRKVRRGRGMAKAEGLPLVRAILRGCCVAHAAGIVHRDMKPANILVNGEGLLKIVDFGLAAAMSHSNSRVTKTGHMVGTPSYMAPEQVRGLPVDQRTDLYALGVIMYELFTGVLPYTADNPMAVLYQHLEGAKAAPRSRNPDIAPQLEGVILKAMAVDADQRYASAADMLCDVEHLMLETA